MNYHDQPEPPQSKHVELEQEIEHIKRQLKPQKPIINGSPGVIIGVAIELIAAILVGLLVGWFFDNLFASKPFCLIICLIISMMASFKAVWHKYVNKNGS